MKRPIFNTLFAKLSSYLICMMPILLVSGPFLSDFFLSIISLIFIFYCYINKNFKYFRHFYFKLFIFFYSICILATLFSDYFSNSFLSSFFYIRFAIFVLIFYFILNLNSKIIVNLFYILLITYVILVLDSFFQYQTGYNIIGIPKKGERLSSFFGTELIIGSYLVRFAPILIGLFFLNDNFNKNKFKSFLFWLLIFTTLIIIFLSGERASFFYSILLLFYLLLMLKNYFFKITIILILFALSVLSIINFDESIKNRMIKQTQIQVGLKENKVIVFSTEHQGHYLVALDLFKNNPFLGVGPKNFRKHCFGNINYAKKPYICSSHPHNTYIQLLSETGLIGFLFVAFIFLIILFYSAKHLYLKIFKKKIYFTNSEVCFLAAFLITLWPIVPNGNFFNNFLNIIYFFPVALFLWSRSSDKMRKSC